jgi:hypothetical protein
MMNERVIDALLAVLLVIIVTCFTFLAMYPVDLISLNLGALS